jgi:hypothetical protein
MHTATLLANGKVLVAGGRDTNGYLNSAEIYDPIADTWTFTGNMNLARAWHTATLLPDGSVLVVGGDNNSVDLDLAELYDPVTGTWFVLGNMNTARYGHTATLLPGGNVLVAGGRNNNLIIKSAELYDPSTNTWITTENLSTERESYPATLMPNGQVLVTGGNGYNSQSVEIFDVGLGFQPLWRSAIDSVTNPLENGAILEITGSGFRGYGHTEASGSTTNNSVSNYPLVQLRSIENGQIRWLAPDANQPISTTHYKSQPIHDFPSGHVLVTIFVNGIPSISDISLLTPPNRFNYLPLVRK